MALVLPWPDTVDQFALKLPSETYCPSVKAAHGQQHRAHKNADREEEVRVLLPRELDVGLGLPWATLRRSLAQVDSFYQQSTI